VAVQRCRQYAPPSPESETKNSIDARTYVPATIKIRLGILRLRAPPDQYGTFCPQGKVAFILRANVKGYMSDVAASGPRVNDICAAPCDEGRLVR